jgi:Lon protease-like protein
MSVYCEACNELLFEPLSLYCGASICKRCYRKNTLYYNCVVCKSKHIVENQINSLIHSLLSKLFPVQQRQLQDLKQLEYSYKEGDIRMDLLDKICNDTILQLPFIIRSKILAEKGQFSEARRDCHKADELNSQNKRGLVSLQLASYFEELQSNPRCRAVSDMRSHLKRVCQDLCQKEIKSHILLNQHLRDHLHLVQKEDFECVLCLDTFVDPISTPCGHTYCRNCLIRSLDCSRQCPTCRLPIPTIGYFMHAKTNKFIYSFLELLNATKPTVPFSFPRIWIPIFFNSLVFPNSTTSFHFFECHYRVMAKRCIEGNKRFGVMLPQVPNNPVQYGTLVEITTFEPLLTCDIIPTCDGNLPRYVVHVKAMSRFRVDEYKTMDGIPMAYITRIEDEQPDPESLEQWITKARTFVAELMKKIPPQARLFLERKHGVMPVDPSDFSFWLGSFLPMNPFVLYQLMPITNVTKRMELLCTWLEEAVSNTPHCPSIQPHNPCQRQM